MTPDECAAIRTAHDRSCAYCSPDDKCSTVRLLDALDAETARAERMDRERANWRRWCLDAEGSRNEARTEVERLTRLHEQAVQDWAGCREALEAREAEVERLTEEIEVLDFQVVGLNEGNIALNAALDRVRALHRPAEFATSWSSSPSHKPHMQTWCAYCASVIAGDPMIVAAYPCATVRAIDGGAS